MKKLSLLYILFSILLTSTFYSQSINENNFENVSSNLNRLNSIFLRAGLKMNSSSNASATISNVKAETNFTGSIGYQYWFNNEWAVKTSIGFFQAKSDINFPDVSTVRILPLLFGFSYHPNVLALGEVGRVYFGVNLGAYIGSGTKTSLSLDNFGSSAITETVFGINPNAGVDFFISKWFMISPVISYHLIEDYNELSVNNLNSSGVVLSVSIGLLL